MAAGVPSSGGSPTDLPHPSTTSLVRWPWCAHRCIPASRSRLRRLFNCRRRHSVANIASAANMRRRVECWRFAEPLAWPHGRSRAASLGPEAPGRQPRPNLRKGVTMSSTNSRTIRAITARRRPAERTPATGKRRSSDARSAQGQPARERSVDASLPTTRHRVPVPLPGSRAVRNGQATIHFGQWGSRGRSQHHLHIKIPATSEEATMKAVEAFQHGHKLKSTGCRAGEIKV